MNKIGYGERCEVYAAALERYGVDKQTTKAIEEMSELTKEICKLKIGDGSLYHLAEEIADVTIMLEQLRIFFDVNDEVCKQMDEKVRRLRRRVSV